MRISIDTVKDSKEDILKAIRLLNSIIGESHITSAHSRNIFDNPQPELPAQQQTFQAQQASSPFGSFFDNINQTQPSVDKKESRTRVELY